MLDKTMVKDRPENDIDINVKRYSLDWCDRLKAY